MYKESNLFSKGQRGEKENFPSPSDTAEFNVGF